MPPFSSSKIVNWILFAIKSVVPLLHMSSVGKIVYFFHNFSISSNVFPLVSGTNFHIKSADKTPIIP